MDVRGRTYYSEKIKGDSGNYDFVVRFDVTDGYIGLTQYDGEEVKDRILLSPSQVTEFLNFARGKKSSRAA